jgi:hypothetical protein
MRARGSSCTRAPEKAGAAQKPWAQQCGWRGVVMRRRERERAVRARARQVLKDEKSLFGRGFSAEGFACCCRSLCRCRLPLLVLRTRRLHARAHTRITRADARRFMPCEATDLRMAQPHLADDCEALCDHVYGLGLDIAGCWFPLLFSIKLHYGHAPQEPPRGILKLVRGGADAAVLRAQWHSHGRGQAGDTALQCRFDARGSLDRTRTPALQAPCEAAAFYHAPLCDLRCEWGCVLGGARRAMGNG